MPRHLALLDDPDFGSEPVVFSCNANLIQRRLGGGVHHEEYLCEAAGAAFSARYDRSASGADEGKRKKGKRRDDDDDSDSDAGEEYVGGKDKKGSSAKQGGAFLKLSDHIKGLNLYELLGISEAATQDEIRKAYRALALTAHPDKQAASVTEDEMKDIQEKFVQIQESYEILSEPSKRQQYDSSLDFDDSLPRYKGGEDEDFYEVFGECFKRNARFSIKRPVPDIGGPDSKPEEWKKFYNFWYEFQSWRDPVVMAQNAGEDICDLNDSECREERRWMIRENDRVAKKYKREETERISVLVNLAEKYDPRIQAEKDAKKEARQAEAKKRAEAQQAVQRAREEEEQKKRAEEEKIRVAEEQKRKEEKAVREAAKNKLKQCRQRVRALHPSVRTTVSLDQLNEVCLRFEEPDLKRLAEAGEKALKKNAEKCASVLHEAIASIGLEPLKQVADDEDGGESTSTGPSSNEKEDPEVLKQKQIQNEKDRVKREKEDAIKAAERAVKDAEKAEEKKKRDEQKRKDQAALDAAKRQQEKKEAEKKKKDEERKIKAEDQEKQKKEQQREEAKIRAQEQAVVDKQKALAHKMEQEMERVVQTFITDRLERLTKLDAATDEALTVALTQALQEDAELRGAWVLLKASSAEAEAEEVLDCAMGLVHKVGPIWVLGLLLDPEIRLPNAVRNRAKKARQRLQTVVQAFLAQAAPAGADAAAANEWQRGIVDGTIAVPVFNLEMKEDEEAAKLAAAAAATPGKEDEQAGKGKKKQKNVGKAKGGGDDEDLDKLLAAIEAPGKASPEGKKAGKKKK